LRINGVPFPNQRILDETMKLITIVADRTVDNGVLEFGLKEAIPEN